MVSHFQISCQSQLGTYQGRTLGTPCVHNSLPCSQNLPHPTCLLTQPSSPPPPPNLTSPLLPLSLLTAKLSKLCVFVLPSNAFAETVALTKKVEDKLVSCMQHQHGNWGCRQVGQRNHKAQREPGCCTARVPGGANGSNCQGGGCARSSQNPFDTPETGG